MIRRPPRSTPLSLHDALPISAPVESSPLLHGNRLFVGAWDHGVHAINAKNERRIWRFEADNEVNTAAAYWRDRKSTRLNSSHANISYAVFCLKKKKTQVHVLP